MYAIIINYYLSSFPVDSPYYTSASSLTACFSWYQTCLWSCRHSVLSGSKDLWRACPSCCSCQGTSFAWQTTPFGPSKCLGLFECCFLAWFHRALLWECDPLDPLYLSSFVIILTFHPLWVPQIFLCLSRSHSILYSPKSSQITRAPIFNKSMSFEQVGSSSDTALSHYLSGIFGQRSTSFSILLISRSFAWCYL